MEQYKNKHRSQSARRPDWDYRTDAAYFITICTLNKQHLFGEISNGEMLLNDIGAIADKYWGEIPDHFSHVQLGEFTIMPNHMHGIVTIKNDNPVETLHCNVYARPGNKNKQPPEILPLVEKNKAMQSMSPKAGSISTIIRSYKSIVSREARKLTPDFAWQGRFHDHIIRNHESYQNISYYILNNPINWEKDKH